MARFLQALVGVVEANQRFLLKRALVQLVLLGIAGAGLSRLSGALWWLSLVLFVLCLLAGVMGAIQLKLHLTMKVEPPWRAIGLGPPDARSKERVLELHSMHGGVTLVAVRSDMVEGLLNAAREDGLEVITEPEALKSLNATSARIEQLREIEALLPHVPSPELRAELSAAFPTMSDERLKEVEILLMAEKDAQTTTSLRGPKPVFEKELRAKLTSPHPDPLASGEGDT